MPNITEHGTKYRVDRDSDIEISISDPDTHTIWLTEEDLVTMIELVVNKAKERH